MKFLVPSILVPEIVKKKNSSISKQIGNESVIVLKKKKMISLVKWNMNHSVPKMKLFKNIKMFKIFNCLRNQAYNVYCDTKINI